MEVEEALLTGEPLRGFGLDYSKCFDKVPIEIVLRLAEACGLGSWILAPTRSMYRRLKRRFKLLGGVGEVFQSTNGILQGCPLSVILLNLLVSVWMRAVETEAPGARPLGYADDTGATAAEQKPLQQALDLTGEFAGLTGQELNAKKSNAWATSTCSSAAPLTLHGVELPSVTATKQLGAQLAFTKRRRCEVMNARTNDAKDVAHRVALAPLSASERGEMVATAAVPKAVYGGAVASAAQKEADGLRQAVLTAVWGPGRKLRAREVVFTLLVPGHRVDPSQALTYLRFRSLRRMLIARPELRATFERVWRCYAAGAAGKVPGPVGLVRDELRKLAWTWPSPYEFGRGSAPRLRLLEEGAEEGRFLHEVRNSIRAAQWRTAAARRADMHGLDQGVDRHASLRLRGDTAAITPYQRGMLDGILAGALRTYHRLFRGNMVPEDVCPFCDAGVPETTRHLWWVCTAWSSIREKYPEAHRCETAPECTARCGIVLATLCSDRSERTRRAMDLHRMMLEILEARWAADKQRGADPDKDDDNGGNDGDDGLDPAAPCAHPGGDAAVWQPSGPFETCGVGPPKQEVTFSGVNGYLYGGPRAFEALAWYLAELRWPLAGCPGASKGVTWTELAVDFELSTGVDIPATRRQLSEDGTKLSRAARAGADAALAEPFREHVLDTVGKRVVCRVCTRDRASCDRKRLMRTHCVGYPEDGASARRRGQRQTAATQRAASGASAPVTRATATAPARPLGERAVTLASAVARVAQLTGSAVRLGDVQKKCRTLVSMGLPPMAGLTRRPVLLAGEHVARVLHDVAARLPPARLRAEQRAGGRLNCRTGGWGALIEPDYSSRPAPLWRRAQVPRRRIRGKRPAPGPATTSASTRPRTTSSLEGKGIHLGPGELHRQAALPAPMRKRPAAAPTAAQPGRKRGRAAPASPD